MKAAQVTDVPPALSELPGHWLTLFADGTIAAVHSGLSQEWFGTADCRGRSFSESLVPSSQLLWDATLWPTLRSQGLLSEALIEIRPASNSEASGPWSAIKLTHWKTQGQGLNLRHVALVMPGVERTRLISELRSARDILEAMPGAVLQVQVDEQGVSFPYASGGLQDLLNITPRLATVEPTALLRTLDEASQDALITTARKASADHESAWNLVLRSRHPPERRLQLSMRRAAGVGLWHGVLIDVSERERLEHQLFVQSETDALTRLPNRKALLNHLKQRIAAGYRFAVCFMDLDRFKKINDSLGHDAGDALLGCLAERLRRGLRSTDVMVGGALDPMAARLGGDEFVIVADNVNDRSQAEALAERIVRMMAAPHRVLDMDLVATLSVGVVLADAGSTPDQVLRDADTAMYEAKRRGRNGWVFFETEMHDRVAGALELEGDLRRALRSGELRAVYQPIVHIETGQVVGMEALARWRHPQRGELSPAVFIPVAEDSGLIIELGDEMLRLACEQFAAWHAQGLPIPKRLSVNLSRAQLADHLLPGRVGRLLADCGLPSERLQLEVTESMAMGDESHRAALVSLRALGVHLALDDFGTGHSSLASLQQFPVQQVKLDRSFVIGLDSSRYHRALVQAVMQVAASLDLEVVAEGVETEAQLRALTELGCVKAQGWFYSKALEAAQMPEYLVACAG